MTDVLVDFHGNCKLLTVEQYNDQSETEKLMNNIDDYKKYLFQLN